MTQRKLVMLTTSMVLLAFARVAGAEWIPVSPGASPGAVEPVLLERPNRRSTCWILPAEPTPHTGFLGDRNLPAAVVPRSAS